jgi:hypothetical protein
MPINIELLSLFSRAPQDRIPDNADGIAIATLYLVVMMVLAVLIRLAFRYTMLRSLQWDDGMVSLALVSLLFSRSSPQVAAFIAVGAF